MSAFAWIKQHKLLVLLALVLAFLIQRSLVSQRPYIDQTGFTESTSPGSSFNVGMSAPSDRGFTTQTQVAYPGYQKLSDSSSRVVIQESNLSLLVTNVRETGDKIIGSARSMGGYMVNASYDSPGEGGFATISVRVPTDRLDQALDQFRGSAVKITNENLYGTDVTQEYQDLDQRIATLKTTKSKFEEILKKATTVDEILRVNQEIINLEAQIDQATGQKAALADNARLTKVTLYLSTDELALPYTPEKTFRPDVIFKLAVRSLLSSLQSFAEILIWTGVYAVIWIPLLIGVIIFKNWRKNSKA